MMIKLLFNSLTYMGKVTQAVFVEGLEFLGFLKHSHLFLIKQTNYEYYAEYKTKYL